MPHADSLALPSSDLPKREFYDHVCSTAEALLAPASETDPAANWITVLSNAASLLYGSYENYVKHFGREDGRRVNWAGTSLLRMITCFSPPHLTDFPACNARILAPSLQASTSSRLS